MDVSVLHKRAQRSPRPSLLVRLLGAGMLERARATSLALLGATAAVGLAIVAFALNQGWPLLEGSAIPAAPRQDVGRASVVARPAPASRAHTATAADRGRVGGRADRAAGSAAARPHAVAVTPSGGDEAAALVVSEQAPARSPGGAPKPKAPSTHGVAPVSPSQPTQPPTPESPATPTAAPAPQPAAAPAPAPVPTQPEAVASEAPPEESNVPSWSHGNGHAYGRGESPHDDGHGGDDHGWDHGGDSHGHW